MLSLRTDKVNGVSISGATVAFESLAVARKRRRKKKRNGRSGRVACTYESTGSRRESTPSPALLSPRTGEEEKRKEKREDRERERERKEKKEHTAEEVGSHGVSELARTRLQEPEVSTATATSVPSSSVVPTLLVSSTSSADPP
mgnify:CR=1 FL=1